MYIVVIEREKKREKNRWRKKNEINNVFIGNH